jgi:transcription factor Dp, invertebrate
VEKKKKTTYNEVADDLVSDLSAETGGPVDQKNIRRRVYDALNVLMAMGIIAKEKKEIQWIGLPTNTKQDMEALERERLSLIESIKRKKTSVSELQTQNMGYKSLLDRNQRLEQLDPTHANTDHLPLPFIIVNTKSQTVISLEVAEDRSAFFFNFSLPFEIHDDSEILKRMGLVDPSPLDLEIDVDVVPKD